eukprot:RCo036667
MGLPFASGPRGINLWRVKQLSKCFQQVPLTQGAVLFHHPSTEDVLAYNMRCMVEEDPARGRPLTPAEVLEVRTRRYQSGHQLPISTLAEELKTSETFIEMCTADAREANLERLVSLRWAKKHRPRPPPQPRIRMPPREEVPRMVSGGMGLKIEHISKMGCCNAT